MAVDDPGLFAAHKTEGPSYRCGRSQHYYYGYFADVSFAPAGLTVLDSVKGELVSKSMIIVPYQRLTLGYQAGDRLGCGISRVDGCIFYTKNGNIMGRNDS